MRVVRVVAASYLTACDAELSSSKMHRIHLACALSNTDHNLCCSQLTLCVPSDLASLRTSSMTAICINSSIPLMAS